MTYVIYVYALYYNEPDYIIQYDIHMLYNLIYIMPGSNSIKYHVQVVQKYNNLQVEMQEIAVSCIILNHIINW